MPISDTEKVDFLFKKVGYELAKTAGSTLKTPDNESRSSPIVVNSKNIWLDSISSTKSTAISQGIVEDFFVELIEDATVAFRKTWLAPSNKNNWISKSYGNTYILSVWVADSGASNEASLTNKTQIQPAGTGSDGFFIDYISGVIHFADTNTPSSLTATRSVYVIGTRYIGALGSDAAKKSLDLTQFSTTQTPASGLRSIINGVSGSGSLVFQSGASLINPSLSGSSLTINGSGFVNAVNAIIDGAVSTSIVAGSGISTVYDSGNNTLIISSPITAGPGISVSLGSSGTYQISATSTSTSTITDFEEKVEDQVNSLLKAPVESGIVLNYIDPLGETGGGTLNIGVNKSALGLNNVQNLALSGINITAGSGLVGGGSIDSSRTLNVGAGDGITVGADTIAVNSTVVRTTGNQNISGDKSFTGTTNFYLDLGNAPLNSFSVHRGDSQSNFLSTIRLIPSGTNYGAIANIISTNAGIEQNLFLPTINGTLALLSDINTSQLTGVLPVTKGGTGRTSYSNGELLIGSGNTLIANTLTSDSGISIINGSGTISINVDNTVIRTTGNQTINGQLIVGSGINLNNSKITNLAEPTQGTDAATKNYVDAIKQGLDIKDSVKVATTGNITLSGAQTIDGISVVAGDRVLVKNQITGSQNGIYIVSTGSWSRAADADSNADVTAGMFTFVEQGDTNQDSGWVLTNNSVDLGIDSLVFVQFNGAGQITPGSGLTKNGNTLNIETASSSRIVVNADNIDLATVGRSNSSVSANTIFLQTLTTDSYGRVTGSTSGTFSDATASTKGIASFNSSTFDVTSGDVTIRSGGVSNNQLANNSVTIGSTNIGLGSTATTLTGLSSITSTTFIGNLSGTVTSGVITSRNINTASGITGGGDLSTDRTLQLATAYGDTVNPYGSKNANTVLAAPTGSNGVPSFRSLVPTDIPGTINSLVVNNAGAGTASPFSFNGSTAQTLSYNSIGAPSISGVNAVGTWSISVTGNAGSVTNGVYTTGVQTIAGAKTFTSLISSSGLSSLGNNDFYLNNSFANSFTINYGNTSSAYGTIKIIPSGSNPGSTSIVSRIGATVTNNTLLLPSIDGTLALLSDINTTQITGVLNVNKGGTGQTSYSNGQLLIGSGTSLAPNTLSAGTGIVINNGSGSITINTNAVSTNTASTIVSRDSSGNFSAGNITATGFIRSGGTSSQFLKADGSVDSTSYVSTARNITISGTANQITSSAGAQDLSLDRTWTLSLPQNIHSAATPTFAGLTINGNISARALPSSSAATQIPVFTADPSGTTQSVVTRTPAQLLTDIGAAASNQTMFIGTTSVAINRSSASLALSGVSIDGNAGSASLINIATTSSNINNLVVVNGTTGNLSSLVNNNLRFDASNNILIGASGTSSDRPPITKLEYFIIDGGTP